MTQWQADIDPLGQVVDLDIGQTRAATFAGGDRATVTLVAVDEICDDVRRAIRRAEVTVEVDGQQATIVSGNYNLPVTVGGAQIDCPVTRGYVARRGGNVWGIERDARLRLWPEGSPWIAPGTFRYPVRQTWFAGDTQMSNEPTFVDGVEPPDPAGRIYYHDGLDFGGCEHLVEVLATADALVIGSGDEVLPDYTAASAVGKRYDRLHLLDRRGWIWRYSHLASIAPGIDVGATVRAGQTVGTMGKEGHSGGWVHLHLGLFLPGAGDAWQSVDAYPFAWQAYVAEQQPRLIAVARPHHLIWSGQAAVLDGRKSWSAGGNITRYQWTFGDGTTAEGPTHPRRYDAAGVYSEMLKVTDAEGNVAIDFVVVQVIDAERKAERLPPGIHAAFHPSDGVTPGRPITFKVRTFGTTHGREVWDFGDGSPVVAAQSDGNVDAWAKDGYAITEHAFAEAGNFIVTVSRTNEHGQTATARLHVRVEEP
jgi:PKD domain-containing protein/peptidase M23-like protein